MAFLGLCITSTVVVRPKPKSLAALLYCMEYVAILSFLEGARACGFVK